MGDALSSGGDGRPGGALEGGNARGISAAGFCISANHLVASGWWPRGPTQLDARRRTWLGIQRQKSVVRGPAGFTAGRCCAAIGQGPSFWRMSSS